MKPLEQIAKELRKLRLNQSSVTLEEARAQARRLKEARRRGEKERYHLDCIATESCKTSREVIEK